MGLDEILSENLIGLTVEVIESTDSTKIGISGKIIDETMNLLTIMTKKGEKKVSKAESTFVFDYKEKKLKVFGKLLVSRPEDKIKRASKLSRRWRFPAFFLKK